MTEKIWRIVTRYGQGPRIWIWPVILYFLTNYLLPSRDLLIPRDNSFLVLLLYALLVSYAAGSAIKFFFWTERPKSREFSNWLEKINAGSFPSIHSSNMTIVVLFFGRFVYTHAMLVGEMHFGALFLSVIIGFIATAIVLSRIELHKHFPIDILGGVIFGTLIVGIVWVMSPLLMAYNVFIFGVEILLIAVLEVLQWSIHQK